jgi:hypothetical protein
VSIGFIACSSDDSGGGTGGGTATGGFGGIGTGGVGTGGVGTGGVGTGGVGTGGVGTGGAGTGGAPSCPATLKDQKCTALTSPNAAQDACFKGQCCASLESCFADAECAGFFACNATCQSGGGTPQVCSQQCQSCIGGSTALITAFNNCITACAGDGGASDAGPGDASTD